MSQMAVPLTIIVISKDDPAGLDATLLSIENQVWRDYEVVVVAMGTSNAANNREYKFPRLIWSPQESEGISRAFNEGITRSTGEWINFLNGGDRYRDRSVLGRMSTNLVKDGCSIVTASSADRRTGIRIPRNGAFRARNLDLVSHQASFFRRALFETHGAYSPEFRIRMDFEWMLRLPTATPTCWVDEVIVDFEGGGISSSRPIGSSFEEFKALRRHNRGALRLATLLAVYLPMRMARHLFRKAIRLVD